MSDYERLITTNKSDVASDSRSEISVNDSGMMCFEENNKNGKSGKLEVINSTTRRSYTGLNETKTLGEAWDPVRTPFPLVNVIPRDSYTKRSVLSTIARLFDTLGLVGPVVPKAKLFILELCAAVLLSKLVKRGIDVLKLESVKVYLWTDSKIVLSWLQKEPMDLKTFVQNRIAKIQDLFPVQQWRHVPSNQNPADLISRVDTEKLLNQELLRNGPEFQTGSDYPNKTVKISENNDAYNSELKSSVQGVQSQEISVDIKCLQQEQRTLPETKLKSLNLFLDSDGVLRVGGRLAVNIEEVSDLSSDAFIATLKRFMSRRVKCAKLFSDNTKNFVGANREIKKLREMVSKPDDQLARYLAAEDIKTVEVYTF
ncbi:integrase catalytic domain-containing protein [Trichonephila clavipes]|nr:integrase catalytic domain-containing protein [Trichonephila clavipes]